MSNRHAALIADLEKLRGLRYLEYKAEIIDSVIERALSALREVDAWQPIESLPRDGEDYLVWWDTAGGVKLVDRACWFGDEVNGRVVMRGANTLVHTNTCYPYGGEYGRPTLKGWMPLPQPPAARNTQN